MSTCLRNSWRAGRGRILAILIGSIAVGLAWWASPPTPRATWSQGNGVPLLFSPDGRSAVCECEEGVGLRDTATGRMRAVLGRMKDGAWEAQQEPIRHANFTADGRVLFGITFRPGDHAAVLKVWDAATGRERAAFDDVGGIWEAAISELSDRQHHVRSADGRRVAFARRGDDGKITAEVWDFSTMTRLSAFADAAPFALSRAGDLVALCTLKVNHPFPATSPAEASIREVVTGRVLRAFPSGRTAGRLVGVISPDGSTLAMATWGRLQLLRLDTGEILLDREGFGGLGTPWFSPDGQRVFSSEFTDFSSRSFLDLSTGKAVWVRLPPDPQDALCMQIFAPDGRTRAVAQYYEGVKLFEDPAERGIATIALEGSQVLAFSPDSRMLALRSKSDGWGPMRVFLARAIPLNLMRKWPSTPRIILQFHDVTSGRLRGWAPWNPVLHAPHAFVFSEQGDIFAIVFPAKAPPKGAVLPRHLWEVVEIWDVPPRRPLGRILTLAALPTLLALALGGRADRRRRRRDLALIPEDYRAEIPPARDTELGVGRGIVPRALPEELAGRLGLLPQESPSRGGI